MYWVNSPRPQNRTLAPGALGLAEPWQQRRGRGCCRAVVDVDVEGVLPDHAWMSGSQVDGGSGAGRLSDARWEERWGNRRIRIGEVLLRRLAARIRRVVEVLR